MPPSVDRVPRPAPLHVAAIAIAATLAMAACSEPPPPSAAPTRPAAGANDPAPAPSGIELRSATVRETAAGAIAAAREIRDRQQAASNGAAGEQTPVETRRTAADRAVRAARELTEQDAAPVARAGPKSAASYAIERARSAGGEQNASGSEAAAAAERHAADEALRAIAEARRLIGPEK